MKKKKFHITVAGRHKYPMFINLETAGSYWRNMRSKWREKNKMKAKYRKGR